NVRSKRMKCWKGERTPRADFICGTGADDESARSDPKGDGREAEVVGGGRNHRGDGPDDASVAAAVRRARLRRAVRLPQGPTQPQAHSGSAAGEGAATVSGEVSISTFGTSTKS